MLIIVVSLLMVFFIGASISMSVALYVHSSYPQETESKFLVFAVFCSIILAMSATITFMHLNGWI